MAPLHSAWRPLTTFGLTLNVFSHKPKWGLMRRKASHTMIHADIVRTPIPSHIDLAGNTSYHFAASRMVSHGCRLTMAF